MATKKKILFRIGSLREGGAERVLVNLLNHLNPQKYEIDLLLNIKYGIYLKHVPSYVRLLHINSYSSSSSLKKAINVLKMKFYTHFPRYIYTYILSKKYDVEIGFNHLLVNEILASPNPKSKKILWLHTDIFERKIATPRYISKMEQFDKVVIIAENMRRDLVQKTNLPDSKIVKIYNALHKTDIQTQAQLSVILPFQNQNPVMTTVGSLSEVKGHSRLIKAHKKAIDKGFLHNLVIVGEGVERKNLEKLIVELGVQNSVYLAGFQKNPYPFIAQAYFYVHSSFAEGFGNVLLEALYLGKPVLTTYIMSAHEILNQETYGKVVDNSSVGLENGIIDLLSHPELVASYAKSIRNAHFPFSLENSIQALEQMLDT